MDCPPPSPCSSTTAAERVFSKALWKTSANTSPGGGLPINGGDGPAVQLLAKLSNIPFPGDLKKPPEDVSAITYDEINSNGTLAWALARAGVPSPPTLAYFANLLVAYAEAQYVTWELDLYNYLETLLRIRNQAVATAHVVPTSDINSEIVFPLDGFTSDGINGSEEFGPTEGWPVALVFPNGAIVASALPDYDTCAYGVFGPIWQYLQQGAGYGGIWQSLADSSDRVLLPRRYAIRHKGVPS
jgi:hypothetical protein